MIQDEGQNSFGMIVFCHENSDSLSQDTKMLLRDNVKPIIFC